MLNSIPSFDSFIEYSTNYINVFLKMPLDLIKLSSIAFPGIFVTVCFLIILLPPKQTIPTKKKYKSDSKTNPTFFILHHSLLMIFLVLLSKKRKLPNNTLDKYAL